MNRKAYFAAGVAALALSVYLASSFLNTRASAAAPLATDCDTSADLVPLVTDQTALPLSNKFGVPFQTVSNDAGHFAFIGNGQNAVFYRAGGGSLFTRVIQSGDEVPGYPGSRVDFIQAIRMNAQGHLAIKIDFAKSDGIAQGVIVRFDGSALAKVVGGDDPAPNTGGRNFERNISLWGFNDLGDIAFTAPLAGANIGATAQPSLFIKPSSSSPVRIIGVGDAVPGHSGNVISSLVERGPLLNSGEIHFGSNLNGTTTTPIAIIVGSVNGARTAAFGSFTSANSRLNNLGELVFSTPFNTPAITPTVYKSTLSGNPIRLLGQGDVVGGFTLNGDITIVAFNDSGDVLFTSNLQGLQGVTGLFRKRGNDPVELIARSNEPAAGVANRNYGTIGGISMDQSGNVSFTASFNAGGTSGFPFAGVFRKPIGQAVTKVSIDSDPAPGGGQFQFPPATQTRTLSGGATIFTANLMDSSADYGIFQDVGGTRNRIMGTDDLLPMGSRQTFRTFKVSGSGDRVGFLAQRAGGGASIAEHVISTQTTSILATDGDTVPMPNNPRVRIDTRNTVFLSDNGFVVFRGFAIGTSYTQPSVLFASSAQGGKQTVFSGFYQPGDGFTYTEPQLSTTTPSSVSSNGTVAFATTRRAPGVPASTSIFRWTQAGGLERVVSVGDTVAGSGASIQVVAALGVAVNNAGQVAFRARTTTSNLDPLGIFIASPGSPPQKIIALGDSLGSMGNFATASTYYDLNSNGEVAFMATSTSGGAGMFVGSSAGLSLIAKNGDPAPGGGTYSMPTASPNAAINDNGDVAFRSDIIGGTGSSALFVRRGTAGTFQMVVKQGQNAPGTTGIFDAIAPVLNGFPEESFQLDNSGNIAFQNAYLDGSMRMFGNWRIKPDNTVEEILVRGVVRPEFGGGAAVTATASTSWNSNSRYPIWARVTGGNFTEGIFLSVPKVCNDTPAGNDVPVTVVDSTTGEAPLSMTFDNVTSPGETTLTTSAGGPTVPTAFQIGDPPLFFNIETTATFSGFIEVCLDVSGVTFPSGGNIRLLHFENNRWKDITTSGPTNGIICGRTRSLSPFTVAEQTGEFEDVEPPMLNPIVDPNPVLVNGLATVSANADDGGGSGIAAQSCGPVDSSTVGTKSVTCSATDNEGNTASATVSYRVVYDFAGFFQPVDNLPALNSVNSGASIPVKFSLAGNQGLAVFAGAPTSSPVGCDASDPGSEIEETVSSGGGGLSYDASTGQYTYVWKTSKAWKGTCRLLNVRFIDDNIYRAKFRFR